MSGYYTPSGVPQTNSKAASAAVRTEFQSISTAFSLFPTLAGNAGRAFVVNGSGDAVVLTVGQLSLAGNLTTSGALTTTGAFSTVFAQTASVTLTLPAVTSTLATTASVSAETTRALAAEALLAPLASPALTGTPTVPTAAPGNNTTIAASTAFVTAAVVAATTGVASFNARTGAVTLQAADVTGVGGAFLASPAFSGNPTAPTASVGDNDTSIATTAFVTAAVAPAFNDVGRNYVMNGMFNIQQRGIGPFTANFAYSADRWQNALGNGSDSISTGLGGITDAGRAQIGDEAAQSDLVAVFSGNSGASGAVVLVHKIERAWRLSGKTVTVSFWAAVTSGTLRVGISLDQNFGTGGSPSASVFGNGTAFTVTTTWTRFSATFTLLSVAGKTFGTNFDDHTQLNIWLSSGSTDAVRSGSVGPQSGTAGFWAVQLEVGGVMTPVEKPDLWQQLLACQRYYQTGNILHYGYNVTGGTLAISNLLPVAMRASPTVVPTFTTNINVTAPSLGAFGSATAVQLAGTVTGTGSFGLVALFTASSDL